MLVISRRALVWIAVIAVLIAAVTVTVTLIVTDDSRPLANTESGTNVALATMSADEKFIAGLDMNGFPLTGSDSDNHALTVIGKSVCRGFDRGWSFPSAADHASVALNMPLTSSHARALVGTFVGASIAVYCPEYLPILDRYAR